MEHTPAESGITWDPTSLNAFPESPRTYLPGTKTTFAGLHDLEQRAGLIACLASRVGCRAQESGSSW